MFNTPKTNQTAFGASYAPPSTSKLSSGEFSSNGNSYGEFSSNGNSYGEFSSNGNSYGEFTIPSLIPRAPASRGTPAVAPHGCSDNCACHAKCYELEHRINKVESSLHNTKLQLQETTDLNHDLTKLVETQADKLRQTNKMLRELLSTHKSMEQQMRTILSRNEEEPPEEVQKQHRLELQEQKLLLLQRQQQMEPSSDEDQDEALSLQQMGSQQRHQSQTMERSSKSSNRGGFAPVDGREQVKADHLLALALHAEFDQQPNRPVTFSQGTKTTVGRALSSLLAPASSPTQQQETQMLELQMLLSGAHPGVSVESAGVNLSLAKLFLQ
jgi:hypothetical protein